MADGTTAMTLAQANKVIDAAFHQGRALAFEGTPMTITEAKYREACAVAEEHRQAAIRRVKTAEEIAWEASQIDTRREGT